MPPKKAQSKAREKFNLKKLPAELQIHVVSFLPPKDALKFSEASEHTKELVAENQWDGVKQFKANSWEFYLGFPRYGQDVSKVMLARIKAGIVKVLVEWTSQDLAQKTMPEFCTWLFLLTVEAASIEMRGIQNMPGSVLAEKVRILEISNSKYSGDISHVTLPFMNTLMHLHTLRLTDLEGNIVVPSLPSLRTLVLSLDNGGTRFTVHSQSKLRALETRGGIAFTSPICAPNLKTLGTNKITEEILKAYPGLTAVKYAGSTRHPALKGVETAWMTGWFDPTLLRDVSVAYLTDVAHNETDQEWRGVTHLYICTYRPIKLQVPDVVEMVCDLDHLECAYTAPKLGKLVLTLALKHFGEFVDKHMKKLHASPRMENLIVLVENDTMSHGFKDQPKGTKQAWRKMIKQLNRDPAWSKLKIVLIPHSIGRVPGSVIQEHADLHLLRHFSSSFECFGKRI